VFFNEKLHWMGGQEDRKTKKSMVRILNRWILPSQSPLRRERKKNKKEVPLRSSPPMTSITRPYYEKQKKTGT
jgi:hypothetical protein